MYGNHEKWVLAGEVVVAFLDCHAEAYLEHYVAPSIDFAFALVDEVQALWVLLYSGAHFVLLVVTLQMTRAKQGPGYYTMDDLDKYFATAASRDGKECYLLGAAAAEALLHPRTLDLGSG